jgi:hypothetical protein
VEAGAQRARMVGSARGVIHAAESVAAHRACGTNLERGQA